VKTKQGKGIGVGDLYDQLIKSYDPEFKKRQECYEIFDSTKKLVKPHIDCERYVSVEDYSEELEENVLKEKLAKLSTFFDCEEVVWAVSKDCTKNSETVFKISFHFVLKNTKMWMKDLKDAIETDKFRRQSHGLEYLQDRYK